MADTLVPQLEYLHQATTEDSAFVMKLRAICDSVLYAYFSKVADTAEKQHYLHLSCTVIDKQPFPDLDEVLDDLQKFEILDLHLSVFQPYGLRVLLVAIRHVSSVFMYFKNFRSDPERSKEFHYEGGPLHAFVAARYMRSLRTMYDSR